MSYQFPSSGGRSASVSSASASQSTHATPVKVSLTAGDSARMAISTTCAMPNSLSWVSACDDCRCELHD